MLDFARADESLAFLGPRFVNNFLFAWQLRQPEHSRPLIVRASSCRTRSDAVCSFNCARSYVSAEPALFSMTVASNIAYRCHLHSPSISAHRTIESHHSADVARVSCDFDAFCSCATPPSMSDIVRCAASRGG